MVRDFFQAIIGQETKEQMHRPPKGLHVDCRNRWRVQRHGAVFSIPDDKEVNIIGVEAGGRCESKMEHCASSGGRPGVLHVSATGRICCKMTTGKFLEGWISLVWITPIMEHSWLQRYYRAQYVTPPMLRRLRRFQLSQTN
jgi:tryptophan synthase beta subunit